MAAAAPIPASGSPQASATATAGGVPATALAPVVTSADRLSFTIFLAAALHAAVILGVTFTFMETTESSRTMEVTLAQHRSRNAPDKADFLAQFQQQGSGTLEKKALTTSPTRADLHDTVIRETTTPQIQAAAEARPERRVVAALANPDRTTALQPDSKKSREADVFNSDERTLLQKSLHIASLEVRLERMRQEHTKRPRIKRLTSLSTTSSTDAYYLHSWRRKIENVGNLNYPSEARRRKLYGSLRLMVAIRPDGSLKEVELLESSGHPVLDDAALRIVKLAAPFAPFPDELRKSTDVLEIIRTWQFRRNSSLRSF